MGSLREEGSRRLMAGRAFERPGEDAGLHAGRGVFFEVLHRLQPRVTGDLMGEPLALYRPLFAAAIDHLPVDTRRWSWRYCESYPMWDTFRYASEFDPPEAHRIRDLLNRWARKWNLGDEWCLEAAVETLAQMSAAEGDPEPEPLYYVDQVGVECPFREDELDFDFHHPGWRSPTLTDWGSAEGDIDAAYARFKMAYKERVERLCREEGLVPVRRTRHRASDHFEWLVLCTVEREHFREVARDRKVSEQAVGKAVKRLASLIDLTLPGHLSPPKSSGQRSPG